MSEKGKICKCGCGKPVTWNKYKKCWNIYLRGHNWKGRKRLWTKEHCEKLSKAKIGKKHSAEHCEKISKSMEGRIVTPKTRRKIGEALRKHKNIKLNPKQYHKFKAKEDRKTLSNSYIIDRLFQGSGLRFTDVPDELVAAKREHIKLGRLLRGIAK